jgi:outer membrane protein, multidrug efflux system
VPDIRHRSLRLALLLIGVSHMAACSTGRTPRATEVRLPATFEGQPQTGAPVPLDRWWSVYDDPQLTALVDQALAAGFDTRTALSRVAEARALRASTLARLGAQGNLEGSGEVRHTENIGGEHGIDFPGIPSGFSLTPSGQSATANLGFNVSWELDLFGRRGASRRAAEGDFAAARFNAEATRVAAAAEIADTLFQARSMAVQIEDARATANIQTELLRISRTRADRGLGASADVARVEADVAQATAQLQELEAQLRTLKRSILLLTANAGAALSAVEVAPDLRAIPTPPALIPGELLVRRPDVREAEARIEAAAGNLTLAELELFPRITLQPGAGLGLQRGTFPSTTAFWAFGLGLSLPILDRGRLLAELRASGARAEQAVLGYERAVQTAYSEADQALTLLEADRNRVAVLRAGEGRARVAYDAAQRRYELGLDNLTTLLDAERAWRAARSAAASAHGQALRRSVQAFRAFGGGWTPETAATPR